MATHDEYNKDHNSVFTPASSQWVSCHKLLFMATAAAPLQKTSEHSFDLTSFGGDCTDIVAAAANWGKGLKDLKDIISLPVLRLLPPSFAKGTQSLRQSVAVYDIRGDLMPFISTVGGLYLTPPEDPSIPIPSQL